jgi:hypothetical protein
LYLKFAKNASVLLSKGIVTQVNATNADANLVGFALKSLQALKGVL